MVGAALSLGVFYGCQKEESLRDSSLFTTSTTDVEKRKPTISIDEAKSWFERMRPKKGTSTSSLGGQDSSLFLTIPKWDSARTKYSQSGTEFVSAPLNLEITGGANSRLLIRRQPNGDLIGRYLLYLPTEEYNKRVKGRHNPLDFTGSVIYTDFGGKYTHGYKIENGEVVGTATVSKKNGGNNTNLGVRACYYETRCTYVPPIFVFNATSDLDCWEVAICSGGGSGGFDPNGGFFGDVSGNGSSSSGTGCSWGCNQPPVVLDDTPFDYYRNVYVQPNRFSEAEFAQLYANSELFPQVDGFLERNDFSTLAINIIKANLNTPFTFQFDGKVDGIIGMDADLMNSNTNEGKLAREAVYDVQAYLYNDIEPTYFPNTTGNALTLDKFQNFAYSFKQTAGFKKLGGLTKSTFLSMKAVLKDNNGNVISSFDDSTSRGLPGESMGQGFGKIDQHLIYDNQSTRALSAFAMQLEDIDTHYKVEISFSIVQIQGQ